MITVFNWFVRITGFPAYVPIFRPKYYFVDRKKQGRHIRKKTIVVSNHRSVWDFMTMLYLFPTRSLRCVVAELMFEKNVFISFLLKGFGAIKVDRESHDFSFLGKATEVLSRGGAIEIYPESRIPKDTEEKPLPFKPSAVYLALETGASIVPVFTNGNYFTKERLRAIVGEPVDVRELYDSTLTESENVERITEVLRGIIIELGEKLEEKTKKNR